MIDIFKSFRGAAAGFATVSSGEESSDKLLWACGPGAGRALEDAAGCACDGCIGEELGPAKSRPRSESTGC